MNIRRYFVAFWVVSAPVRAQTEPPTVGFTFANPGARSLGVGGAFAALADDATASVANPSGLVQLARPEVSLEARGRGDLSGTSTRSASGIQTSSGFSAVSGVGFLSFVYPRGDWSFAIYRHQVANLESFSGAQGVIGPGVGSGLAGAVEAGTAANLEMVTYGLSTGYRINESLDVGAGLTYFGGKLSSQTGYSLLLPTAPAVQTGTKTIGVDDHDWGLSAGFIWHVSGQMSVGGFYRQAPSFEANADERTTRDLSEERIEISTDDVRFPDIFGAGIVYQSKGGSVTASAEWDHVRYSLSGGGIFEDVDVKDVDEPHFGLEYAFLGITPVVALRVGTWYEPGRRVRFVGQSILSGAEIQGANRWHFAFGAGAAVRHFQFDLGVDISRLVVTASLSAIVSF